MKADKLYLGTIITMDAYKLYGEAMTVKDGLVQYVGSEETARSLCDENTEVVDLRGNCIYPGFLESHCHVMGAGVVQDTDFLCDLNDAQSMEECLKILEDFIKARPERENYKGNGFVERDVKPHHSMLDAICADKPIVVRTVDGHSMWLNAKAMEIYGINKESAVSYGPAQVRVDENGEPTGYISEKPVFDINGKMETTMEDSVRFLMNAQKFFFSKGYTAVYDAGLELTNKMALGAYQNAIASGKFKMRTYTGSVIDEKCQDISAAVEAIDEKRKKYNSEYFNILGVKTFSDGVVEAHTAYLMDDYCDQAGYKGVGRMVEHDKLVELYTKASEMGMSVHVHTVGDRAIRVNLDAIEEAAVKTGKMDQRFALAHLQIVKPEDIQRFADLNVTAVVAPLWSPKAPAYFEQEVEYVGSDRAEAAYPIKDFFEAGANTVYHTDYPVSRSVNIPETFFCAETRRNIRNLTIPARNPAQAPYRYQSLEAMTTNVAHMWHADDKLGSLAPGKVANMTVFNCNFLTDDLVTVGTAELVCTVVDGEIVYKNEQ